MIDTVLVVPSERDGHGNSRIALALPPEFTPKSCGSPIGWRCTTADKGFTWERVTGLVEAEDFDLRMQVASTPGTYVLPLAQTYDDGETRTFTSGPGSRDEAPLFTVTGNGASAGPTASATVTSTAPVPSTSTAGASPERATVSASPSRSAASTSASPTGAGASVPTSAGPAEGLGSLPAGRRLDPPSSNDAPIVLVAVGFLALTVLGGGVLFVRQRQTAPPAERE